jgi:3'(2'), 5'-bisphosphate nucleotidase
VLGVIHVPVTNECFYASHKNGAFKINADKSSQAIRCRPMRKQTPVFAVSGHRDNRVLNEFLNKVGEHEIMYIGSSIKSCRVAEGIADIYPCLGPTSEWDTAAAQCIIEEAGGSLVNLRGEPLRYNTKESLTNGWFFVYGDASYDWLSYLGAEYKNN